METEGAAGPTPTSGRQDGTDRPRDRPPVETMSNNVGAGQIGRQHLEQLAQELAEEVIEDALEHYLRRELQQTAEETVREALAAAGAGQIGGSQAEVSGTRARGVELGGGRGAAELREHAQEGDEDDESELERTLIHDLDAATGRKDDEFQPDRSRANYSMSPPSRLDADDIFQDLSEMSSFADRIDSILEQTVSEHSTRSGRMRSVSPMPQVAAAFEQREIEEEEEEEAAETEAEDGEVD